MRETDGGPSESQVEAALEAWIEARAMLHEQGEAMFFALLAAGLVNSPRAVDAPLMTACSACGQPVRSLTSTGTGSVRVVNRWEHVREGAGHAAQAPNVAVSLEPNPCGEATA